MDRRMVGLTFGDRDTTITLGMLQHIINCSINHLLQLKTALITKPFDFESPTPPKTGGLKTERVS